MTKVTAKKGLHRVRVRARVKVRVKVLGLGLGLGLVLGRHYRGAHVALGAAAVRYGQQ